MESSISLQLVDLLVYLIPGALILGVSLFTFVPDALRREHQHHPWIRLASFLVSSYVLGVVLLMASKSVLYAYEWLVGEPLFSRIIASFPDLDVVRRGVSEKVGVKITDPVHCYRYADALLVHASPSNALQAERLFCLGLLCRNLVLALPLSGMLLLGKSASVLQRRRLALLGRGVVLVALAVVVYKGFVSYTTASVWRTLRAYVATMERLEPPRASESALGAWAPNPRPQPDVTADAVPRG